MPKKRQIAPARTTGLQFGAHALSTKGGRAIHRFTKQIAGGYICNEQAKNDKYCDLDSGHDGKHSCRYKYWAGVGWRKGRTWWGDANRQGAVTAAKTPLVGMKALFLLYVTGATVGELSRWYGIQEPRIAEAMAQAGAAGARMKSKLNA